MKTPAWLARPPVWFFGVFFSRPLWKSGFGKPPVEAFWTSLVCWHSSDPLPASGFLMLPRTASPFLSLSLLSSPSEVEWGDCAMQNNTGHNDGACRVWDRKERKKSIILIRRWDSRKVGESRSVGKDQFQFTCHSVQPLMGLLSPSCWDAPEGPAHWLYCSYSWPGPQLNNTASVCWLNWSDRDTSAQFSLSDWCSLCVATTSRELTGRRSLC